MLARRQHGDDRLGALDGGAGARSDLDAAFGGLVREGGDEIEAADLVAGLDEIERHRPAHVAEADEGDPGHDVLVSRLLVAGDDRHARPIMSRATITRMISLVPSRI